MRSLHTGPKVNKHPVYRMIVSINLTLSSCSCSFQFERKFIESKKHKRHNSQPNNVAGKNTKSCSTFTCKQICREKYSNRLKKVAVRNDAKGKQDMIGFA